MFSSNDPAEGSSSTASDTGVTEMNVQDPERYSSKTANEEVTDRASSEEVPNEAAQDGVTEAEAITLTWNKWSMAATYFL